MEGRTTAQGTRENVLAHVGIPVSHPNMTQFIPYFISVTHLYKCCILRVV